MKTGRLPWGADHHRAYRRLFGHRAGMAAICEDLPEEHNTCHARSGSEGLQRHSGAEDQLHDQRKQPPDAGSRGRPGEEILQAAGARDIGVELPITEGGWHLMGTARMGTDPSRSVVNEWGRSHDVNNLFIIDGSIFVTSAAVNPTRTIQALALYIADAMKQRLATLFD